MNKQKNTAHRFNIIDVIVLLLIALGIFWGIRASSVHLGGGGEYTVYCTVRISPVTVSDAAKISVGDVLCAVSGEELGTIVDCKQMPYTKNVFDYGTDRYIRSELDGKLSVYATAEVKCRMKDGRFYTSDGNVLLCAGEPINILMPVGGGIEVISVREKETAHEKP